MELGKGLECKSEKEWVRELGLFSLGEEVQGGPYHSLQLPQRRL